jgi:Sec-independent protein translocase protein TatA
MNPRTQNIKRTITNFIKEFKKFKEDTKKKFNEFKEKELNETKSKRCLRKHKDKADGNDEDNPRLEN